MGWTHRGEAFVTSKSTPHSMEGELSPPLFNAESSADSTNSSDDQ